MGDQSSKPTTILIVEDEEQLRSAMSTKFRALGYEVVEAQNGKEGLERLQATHPDVVVLDQVMPVMDGQQMLDAMKQMQLNPQPHVIIITNIVENTAVNVSLQKGIQDYLIKSDVTLEDIGYLIERRLQKPKS